MDICTQGEQLQALRIEQVRQLRFFESEMHHLVLNSLRNWQSPHCTLEQAKGLTADIAASLPSPRSVLMVTLDTEGVHWGGFLWGLANMKSDAFELAAWYVKDGLMPVGFEILFDLLDRFCFVTRLNRIEFGCVQQVSFGNPRWRAFASRYQPKSFYTADIVEAKDGKPRTDTMPRRDAAGNGAGCDEGDGRPGVRAHQPGDGCDDDAGVRA